MPAHEANESTTHLTGRSRAGSKGGLTTKQRKGIEFFRTIGRKGGSSRSRRK